jgi:hypothetical protein
VTTARCPSHADMYAAQRSPGERERVDRAYAAWLGLPDDEVGAFLARLKLYDLRHAARLEREAVAELSAAREARMALLRGETQQGREAA